MAQRNPRSAYWKKGEGIGQPIQNFKHLAYNPMENTKPDLGLALEGAYIDVKPDMKDAFEQFGNVVKCLMVIKVRYEPIDPTDENHKGFDAYLAVPPTRIFKNDGIVNGWGNPYRNDIEILSDRIKVANFKFIRDQSGLVFAEIIIYI